LASTSNRACNAARTRSFEAAKHRVLVKRIFCKHGHTLDKQDQATVTVLEQAESLSFDLAA
jgi:hypothetical protein